MQNATMQTDLLELTKSVGTRDDAGVRQLDATKLDLLQGIAMEEISKVKQMMLKGPGWKNRMLATMAFIQELVEDMLPGTSDL
ncbi:hypothetical protein [Oryza sativa Japonica Group]|uniref:Uncharacterized protein n=1 Tax=Oryza sativa subsp. japonica TaxID=39947 RepID=Q5ZB55_ORYSJ|nr:hypothetical protein OsJ_02469 [Oryza sativa Japonica Group]BAD53177.1 hypothetical protein [Oryza sativa Japonica Group]